MTRVNTALDMLSSSLLNFANSYAGTSTTAPTATTFTTDGVNIPANSVVGQAIVTGTVFGIIQSNTSATNSVLTVDRWYSNTAVPANVGVAAATTPAAGAWQISQGNVPSAYMGLSATGGATAGNETTLAGEVTTAGGGLIRQLATYAHTAATGSPAGATTGSTTTLVKTFTMNGSDATLTALAIGVFQGVVVASSRLLFRSLLNASMAFSLSGDQGQVTDTVTL